MLTKTVTGANGRTLYARVRARDRAGNNGLWSGNSDGIKVDTVAPRLSAAGPRNYLAVDLGFSEAVVNADKASNYVCSRGLRVLQAQRLGTAGTAYLLHTTAQIPGTSYTVTVLPSVKDPAGNPVDPRYPVARVQWRRENGCGTMGFVPVK